MQLDARALSLPGVILFTPRGHADSRGEFTELFRASDLAQHGIDKFVQCNYAWSRRGALRGLHFQIPPSTLAKALCCVAGRIYDVVADVRKGSPTFGNWVGVELSADTLQLLYVPHGFAHGYLALEDNTGVLYNQTDYYRPELERAVAWNDRDLAIHWPLTEAPVVSDKDAAAPFLASL